MFLLFPVMLFAAELPDQNGRQAVSTVGDGSSFEKAVIIKHVGDYQKSIDQEYKYLTEKFGIEGEEWVLNKQLFVNREGKFYDETTIEFLSKETKTLYFDITEPFNKINK